MKQLLLLLITIALTSCSTSRSVRILNATPREIASIDVSLQRTTGRGISSGDSIEFTPIDYGKYITPVYLRIDGELRQYDIPSNLISRGSQIIVHDHNNVVLESHKGKFRVSKK